MKIRNLINRNGNPAANQFVIEDNNDVYFQSYQSIVAKISSGKLYLSYYWDYSKTTLKHLRIFLEDYGYTYSSVNEIRSAIKKGEITYTKKI